MDDLNLIKKLMRSIHDRQRSWGDSRTKAFIGGPLGDFHGPMRSSWNGPTLPLVIRGQRGHYEPWGMREMRWKPD